MTLSRDSWGLLCFRQVMGLGAPLWRFLMRDRRAKIQGVTCVGNIRKAAGDWPHSMTLSRGSWVPRMSARFLECGQSSAALDCHDGRISKVRCRMPGGVALWISLRQLLQKRPPEFRWPWLRGVVD